MFLYIQRFLAGNLKWDDYRFYHWAGIDIFCYFSHEYVTIPTFAWIQAAHLHGVAVLGTLIFENDKGQHNLVQILKSEKYMSAIVEALVFVAKHCRFEGWLLNVECTLAPKRIPMLRRFVEVLTQRMHEEVPHGTVIWYDSIIDTGELIWQDELNDKNKQFFDACDGILLNYTWKEENLENSADAVERSDKEMAKIFVGIDVFGRGQVAGFQSNKVLFILFDMSKSYNSIYTSRLLLKFVSTIFPLEYSHQAGHSKKCPGLVSTSTLNEVQTFAIGISSNETIVSGRCYGLRCTPDHMLSCHFIHPFAWDPENNVTLMEFCVNQLEDG